MLAWGIGTTGQTWCIACGGIKTPTDSPTLVYKLGQVCVNSCGMQAVYICCGRKNYVDCRCDVGQDECIGSKRFTVERYSCSIPLSCSFQSRRTQLTSRYGNSYYLPHDAMRDAMESCGVRLFVRSGVCHVHVFYQTNKHIFKIFSPPLF